MTCVFFFGQAQFCFDSAPVAIFFSTIRIAMAPLFSPQLIHQGDLDREKLSDLLLHSKSDGINRFSYLFLKKKYKYDDSNIPLSIPFSHTDCR